MVEKNPCFPSWAPKIGVMYWRQLELDKIRHLENVSRFIGEEQKAGRIAERCNTSTLVGDFSRDDFEVMWADAVCRMLTSDGMRAAFCCLEERKIDLHLLLLSAARGYLGPVGSERKAKRERDEWLANVTETAIKLASLIKQSPLDKCLTDKFQAAHANAIVKDCFRLLAPDAQPVKSDYSAFFPKPSTMSGLLLEFAENARQIASADRVMARPGDKEAKRAYFIRTVTDFLYKETGRPLRKVVAAMTSAAFDVEIEESQISRIAPVGKKDNR